MHPLDLAVIVIYAVGIVVFGLVAGIRANKKARTEDKASNYFLAGGNLKWPVIGLALFATNISTVHLVGLAEAGYASGLAKGNFEIMAGLCLAILAIFFAPIFIRSKVATLPDFLEQRYSRGSRDIVAILSIFSAIVIHIGFSLLAGASVINGMFGLDWNITTSIFVIAILTGIYTIIGGLTAVVVTESIQTIIMLIGAILITAIGFYKVGGWEGINTHVPADHFKMFADDYMRDQSLLRWWSFIPGYLIIGIWYWCTDQTIVQRVLGAKDENHARVGALFAGFIKLLPIFIIVLPGVICLSLVNQGLLDGSKFQAKDTLVFMISEILPIGLKGLMAATLLSAVMSTVSGALNSIGTLVSYDLVKRWNPSISEISLVTTGRIAGTVALVLAIIWSISLDPAGIFDKIQQVIINIAPPITCVFVFGVFWKKASAKASIATLLIGSAIGISIFILDTRKLQSWIDFKHQLTLDYMLVGVVIFAICSVIMIVTSLIFPHKHSAASEKLVWNSPLEALQGKPWPGIGNYKFLSALLVLCLIGIYLWLA